MSLRARVSLPFEPQSMSKEAYLDLEIGMQQGLTLEWCITIICDHESRVETVTI